MTNKELFIKELADNLGENIAPGQLREVMLNKIKESAPLFLEAMIQGRALIDGPAAVKTFKSLKIRRTYKALREFCSK